MKKSLVRIAFVSSALALAPAQAETVEELKRQLEAQKEINALLKQRIRNLEEKQAQEKRDEAAVIAVAPAHPQTNHAPKPEAGDPEGDRALERALVRRGLSVLRPGQFELTPGLIWGHDGSDAIGSRRDDYAATLDARAGLPWDMMIGVGAPYFLQSDTPFGDNSGIGDVSVRLWKQLIPQDDHMPSLVGSIRYTASTGDDPFQTAIPLGSGFDRINGTLTAVKSIDPVVFHGDVFYTHSFSERYEGARIQPGDVFGGRVGATLAVTPDISASASVRLASIDDLERDGSRVDGSDRTIGFLELGTGFVISRQVYLSLSADVGITDDAPDLELGVSLPVRF